MVGLGRGAGFDERRNDGGCSIGESCGTDFFPVKFECLLVLALLHQFFDYFLGCRL